MLANLRKNAFVSIFTESIVAASYFERGSNQFPKETKRRVAYIQPYIFGGSGFPFASHAEMRIVSPS